jgi:two-component system chemotaxis response regulator CheY
MLMTLLDQRDKFLAAMSGGADDFLRKPVDAVELQGRLVAAERVTALYKQLAAQQAELERLNQRFFEEGRIDRLTGTHNRLRLDEDIQDLASRAERYGHRYAVALFDIDHFKNFNDTYGHLAGDNALRLVAQALKDGCRAGDAVYRFGGEEFLMILVEQQSEGAVAAINRHRKNVAALAIPHPASPTGSVTMSAGVTVIEPKAKRPVLDFLAEADRALYFAKASGRNRVAVFSEPGPSLYDENAEQPY